jgi:hypothetical protein
MDAHTISEKIMKYWMCIVPKNSGELNKTKEKIKVCVMTNEGLREVVGVHIQDNFIQLELDKE